MFDMEHDDVPIFALTLYVAVLLCKKYMFILRRQLHFLPFTSILYSVESTGVQKAAARPST